MANDYFLTLDNRQDPLNANRLWRKTGGSGQTINVVVANGLPMVSEDLAEGVASLLDRPTLVFAAPGPSGDAPLASGLPNLRVRRANPGMILSCFSEGVVDLSNAHMSKKIMSLGGGQRLSRMKWQFIRNKRGLFVLAGDIQGAEIELAWTHPPAPHGVGEGKWSGQFRGPSDNRLKLSGPAAIGRATICFNSLDLDPDDLDAYEDELKLSERNTLHDGTFYDMKAGQPFLRNTVGGVSFIENQTFVGEPGSLAGFFTAGLTLFRGCKFFISPAGSPGAAATFADLVNSETYCGADACSFFPSPA